MILATVAGSDQIQEKYAVIHVTIPLTSLNMWANLRKETSSTTTMKENRRFASRGSGFDKNRRA
jgi:hypothetical protein